MSTPENQQHEQYVVLSSLILLYFVLHGVANGLLADTDRLFDSPLQAWMSEDNCQDDFNARLAQRSTLSTNHDIQVVRSYLAVSQARSHQTSTVVHARSEYDLESMASDHAPGLTRASSISSNSSACRTDGASPIDGGCVLNSEDGVLTLPVRFQADADLLCPFQVLECDQTFSDIVEFKIHVFSHFRGHPLPPFAPCFLCGRAFFQRAEDDNAMAWNNLLAHMAYEHYRGGEEEFTIKPEVAVMRYMWNRGIITDDEFKRTQFRAPVTRLPRIDHGRNILGRVLEAPMAPPAPMPWEIRQHIQQSGGGSNDEPFTVFAGRRQERRQANRLRLITRVRGNL